MAALARFESCFEYLTLPMVALFELLSDTVAPAMS